ncbi:MAG: sulfate ABC transporter ATP-binding protein [Sulfobacillus benefaciens]|uniref:Sulfate ABC transporter ATP-binding protein n=1 Tax=Sulfobacillus benefaciens TaxID=453960 RepID=A0A2T2XKP4_9FIRM|nr:MAG: sulfate ABC transporter ATP-binding protein [Sulfobacillus benefaciens]
MESVFSLECHALTFRYGRAAALDGVTFGCTQGESVALLGPNGAGKTTLIKLCLGLLTPTQGTVTVLGQDPKVAARNGIIGTMLQHTHLPGDATVAELLRFQQALYEHPLPMADVVETAGISEILTKRTDRLSGGQIRRVEFAMAIAGNPAVLFLDEPTEGMDLATRQEFWHRLDILKNYGTTVLFASHDLTETDRYSDRILLLSQGHKVAFDQPEQLKRSLGLPRIRFRLQIPLTVEDLSERLRCQVILESEGYVAVTPHVDETLRRIVALPQQAYHFALEDSGLDEVFSHLTAMGGDRHEEIMGRN